MGETFTAEEVREYLNDECIEAGGQKAWATKAGVSPQYVTDVLRGYRAPGDSILQALGFVKVVTYVPTPTEGSRP